MSLSEPIEDTPLLDPFGFARDFDESGTQSPGRNLLTDSQMSSFEVSDEQSGDLVAVFVVAFDTQHHSGNVVEWSEPEDVELAGVEFKALISGAHTLEEDFVFFQKDNNYGLACYGKIAVENEGERGARMKSVGAISPSYSSLLKHKAFLQAQVQEHLARPSGGYEMLSEFYDQHKGVIPLRNIVSQALGALPRPPKIYHPPECFDELIAYYGPRVCTLWKFALLHKRIIFYSHPPIGPVCFRVHCTRLLGDNTVGAADQRDLKPFFYVNVADIDALESELSFVACTTESIFEMKTKLWDLYVHDTDFRAHTHGHADILKTSPADSQRMERLELHRSIMSQEVSPEETVTRFFTTENDNIFTTLFEVADSDERTLTSAHFTAMKLDPKADRPFVMELLEVYGIDCDLESSCCPLF